MSSETVDVDEGYNPLTPGDDDRKLYEWQAVPATGAGDAMTKMMTGLVQQGFHYASTVAPPTGHAEMPLRDRGGVHLYRLLKDKNYLEMEEKIITKKVLEYQAQILALRMEVDQKSVEIGKFRQEHPELGWK